MLYKQLILKLNLLFLIKVFSMFDAYFDNLTLNTGTSGFEYKLTTFISDSVESDTATRQSVLKPHFWSRLNANLLHRIEASSKNNIDQASLISKLCHLFSPFWTRFSQTNKSTSLLSTVQIIFSIFLNNFKENNNDVSNIQSITSLCKHFMHSSLVSSFLAVHSATDIETCFQKLISCADFSTTGFPLVDLYLLFKNTTEQRNSNRDQDLAMLDRIFEYYLMGEENSAMLTWFLESNKFSGLFVEVYLADLAVSSCEIQSKRLAYLEKFIKLVIDSNSFFMKVDLFYEQLVKLSIQLIGEFLNLRTDLTLNSNIDRFLI